MKKTLAILPSFFLSLAAASLFMPRNINNICIILFCLSCFCNFSSEKLKNYFLKDAIALLSVSLFLLFMAGVMLSTDQHEAWKYLERKLSFLLFPFCFALIRPLDQDKVNTVLKSFVLTAIVIAFYCLLVSSLRLLNGGENHFFYHDLSAAIGFNAIYLSIYFLFSIIFIIEYHLFEAYRKLLIPFMALMIFLLASKMLMLLCLLYLLHTLWLRQLKPGKKLLAALGLTILFATGALLIPSIRERIEDEMRSKPEVVTLDHYRYDTPFSGLSLRLVLAKLSFQILTREKAWLAGTGSGDFQHKLDQIYTEKGLYMGNPALHDSGYKGYNPHNQYVEILLASGLCGLALFIMWITSIFMRAAQSNSRALFMLLLLMLLTCLSECVLSANKGIVGFVFFCFLLSAGKPGKTGNQPKISTYTGIL